MKKKSYMLIQILKSGQEMLNKLHTYNPDYITIYIFCIKSKFYNIVINFLEW